MGKIPATSKTLECLRNLGYEVDICERFIKHHGSFGQRKDLFGLFDLLAFNDDYVLGVQCFTTSWAEHLSKLEEPERRPLLIKWLKSDRLFEMWGWRRLKLFRGSKAIRLVPKIVSVSYDGYTDKLLFDEMELHYG